MLVSRFMTSFQSVETFFLFATLSWNFCSLEKWEHRRCLWQSISGWLRLSHIFVSTLSDSFFWFVKSIWGRSIRVYQWEGQRLYDRLGRVSPQATPQHTYLSRVDVHCPADGSIAQNNWYLTFQLRTTVKSGRSKNFSEVCTCGRVERCNF